jgi:hypothetical protein
MVVACSPAGPDSDDDDDGGPSICFFGDCDEASDPVWSPDGEASSGSSGDEPETTWADGETDSEGTDGEGGSTDDEGGGSTDDGEGGGGGSDDDDGGGSTDDTGDHGGGGGGGSGDGGPPSECYSYEAKMVGCFGRDS